ncbi:hypothetical protein BaRGS_00033082 [Batillaria attramentaria]|uniref:Uncharacterized protein n=1 Tax=Batillaria attramentaria TaxID=370345 RepID=A0ABD0JLA7_9CAEN
MKTNHSDLVREFLVFSCCFLATHCAASVSVCHSPNVQKDPVESQEETSDRSLGLNGVQLQVGVNTWYPYVIETGTKNGNVSYTGLCMDLLQYLAQSLNFSYELVLPSDGEWGEKRGGNWTGLVGLIQRREVDMVVAPVGLDVDRSAVVDWTVPFEYWYYIVVVKTAELDLWTVFLRPFHWQVYVCILGSFLCCTAIFSCLMETDRTVHGKFTPAVFGVAEFLLGVCLKQALPTAWTGGAARVLIAAWCLLGLILTSCYTCRLTSLLVALPSHVPFTSLAEMAERDDYRWGVIGGTSTVMQLRQSNDSVLKSVYRGMLTFAQDDPEVFSLDRDVHLSKILSSRYAFITEGFSEAMLAEKDRLTYFAVPEFGSKMYSIFTQKNSTLTWRLDKVLLRLQDAGMMHHLRKRWLPQQANHPASRSSRTTITLETMQGPFYIAVGGLVSAAIALLAEMTIGRRLACEKHTYKND